MLVLEIKNLKIGYKNRSLLSEEFSFKIDSEDIWGIVGPNGSGKTTLLKSIIGLINPISGNIKKNFKSVGYVQQKAQIDSIFTLSPLDIISFTLSSKKNPFKVFKSNYKKTAYDLLVNMGLKEESIHISFNSLSGGQKQRVLIAKALAIEPELLVFDEPTEGMDIIGESDFFSLIKTLNKDKKIPIIIVTHSLNLISSYTNNLILFHNENKIEIGETRKLLTQSKMEEIYGKKIIVKNIDNKIIVYVDKE